MICSVINRLAFISSVLSFEWRQRGAGQDRVMPVSQNLQKGSASINCRSTHKIDSPAINYIYFPQRMW
jgi:hypothetical protein